ncbi:hypothetical protein BC936DRAFT_143043 [Jimgerdemannia flammicorona]|uniref:Uncharacterized protein n=1 Tax=Jimgerdemannia flammicorona TaxID=994334 RepID=A0A433DEI2_9FUNG|nr:hypothetical protein BC936DRAFT_143043 [Jimgerdemannia flammicorona]
MVVAYLWWIPHLYNGLQDPQSLHGQNLCAHARSAVLLRSFDEVPSNYVNVIHRPEGKLGLLGEEVYRDYVTLSGGEDALGVGITDDRGLTLHPIMNSGAITTRSHPREGPFCRSTRSNRISAHSVTLDIDITPTWWRRHQMKEAEHTQMTMDGNCA